MKYALIAVSLVIVTYLVMEFNNRTVELSRLQNEREIISAQMESREKTKTTLEEKIAYATSDAAVLEWAYENHMIRPGDVPVAPLQPVKSTPLPKDQPSVIATETSNLREWLMLFFDPQASSP